MLFLSEFLIALIVGLLLTALFSALFANYRSWDALLVFFLVVFLASWVSGLWITPFGPLLFDVYFFPYLIGALLFGLLLMALFPDVPPAGTPVGDSTVRDQQRETDTLLATLGLIFWLFIGFMVVAIVWSYLFI